MPVRSARAKKWLTEARNHPRYNFMQLFFSKFQLEAYYMPLLKFFVMTKMDIFLSQVNKLLQQYLKSADLSELEKTGIQISVYSIFERNFDQEALFYELLDYLEEEADLPELIPEIETYYSNLK